MDEKMMIEWFKKQTDWDVIKYERWDENLYRVFYKKPTGTYKTRWVYNVLVYFGGNTQYILSENTTRVEKV